MPLGVYVALEHVPDLPEHRVVVTRLGIATDDAPPIVPRPPSRSRRFVILTVGRLHAVKNHEFLIEACRRLADDGFDFECRIVGAGARRQALIRRIGELGLDDRVRVLGSMPPLDVRQQYASADLFVLTSRSEGVPIVLMEAMLHGVPVIAPAITGIPEIIADGETGTLYRPGDLDDLVARIRAEASAPSGEAMRRRAQARVLADYDGAINTAAFAQQLVPGGASVAPKRGCGATTS